jgi:hypothetical protein
MESYLDPRILRNHALVIHRGVLSLSPYAAPLKLPMRHSELCGDIVWGMSSCRSCTLGDRVSMDSRLVPSSQYLFRDQISNSVVEHICIDFFFHVG